MSIFKTQFRNFADNRSGTVTLLFGVMIFVVFGMIGLAIDTSRFYSVSHRLQAALDESALAGAKLLTDETKTDGDIKRMTRAHFRAAIKQLGVKLENRSRLQVDIDRENSTVVTTNTVTVRSMFGPLLGQSEMVPIAQTSKVVYDNKKLELAMVLDVTGSMDRNNKLHDMKEAAQDVVDILFKDAQTDKDVKIALAPYSASVNAGSLAAAVTSTEPTQWCTRKNGNGRGKGHGKGHDEDVTCEPITHDVDPCVVERSNMNAATDAAPTGMNALPNVPSNEYYNSFDKNRDPDGHYECPDAVVAPLRGKNEMDAIKDTIRHFNAGGYTAGQIGTAWGWYLLSPEWKSVLPSKSEPEPYDEKKVNKAMIIMTDGLFNTEYTSGATPQDSVMTEKSYAGFKALCDGAKAKKIQIYTVYLAVNEHDDRAAAELTACASGPANFFDVSSGVDLKKAFRSIANKLSGLRVAS